MKYSYYDMFGLNVAFPWQTDTYRYFVRAKMKNDKGNKIKNCQQE